MFSSIAATSMEIKTRAKTKTDCEKKGGEWTRVTNFTKLASHALDIRIQQAPKSICQVK